jgi:hypothetical protein
MSTGASYLPGGVNTRNPGSFLNEAAARAVPSLPSFGRGVSTERVDNAFAGGPDGPSDLELLRLQQEQNARRIAELTEAAAGGSPSEVAEDAAPTSPFGEFLPSERPAMAPAPVMAQPDFMPAMYQLPPISQFQQPGMPPPAPPPPFMPYFPQQQMPQQMPPQMQAPQQVPPMGQGITSAALLRGLF